MQTARIGWRVVVAGWVLAASAGAQWIENFDSYAPGQLSKQSNWRLFGGLDANVVTTPFFTPPHSAQVLANTDVAHDVAASPLGFQPTSGQWILSVKIWVDASAFGNGWFRVLNSYPNNPSYAVKVTFDADQNTVVDAATNNKVPLLYDQWVSFIVWLDLDADVYHLYYGKRLLAKNLSWTNTFPPAGPAQLAGVELMGFQNLDDMYYDDLRLEPGFGNCVTLVSAPNPVAGGQTLTLTSSSPFLGSGDFGALFAWTINGAGFYQAIAFPFYNSEGKWIVSGPVPSGLSGLQVGFKALALPLGGGPLMLSNEDLVVFL